VSARRACERRARSSARESAVSARRARAARLGVWGAVAVQGGTQRGSRRWLCRRLPEARSASLLPALCAGCKRELCSRPAARTKHTDARTRRKRATRVTEDRSEVRESPRLGLWRSSPSIFSQQPISERLGFSKKSRQNSSQTRQHVFRPPTPGFVSAVAPRT